MARTGQQNASMGLSNDVIGMAQQDPEQRNDARIIPFLQQVAIPQSQTNMALFRALDEGSTEGRGEWPTQMGHTIDGLSKLYADYKDQLDPGTQVGLVQAINGRLKPGQTPLEMPTLTEDVFKHLSFETQIAYAMQHPDEPWLANYLDPAIYQGGR